MPWAVGPFQDRSITALRFAPDPNARVFPFSISVFDPVIGRIFATSVERLFNSFKKFSCVNIRGRRDKYIDEVRVYIFSFI
jgi:hypothetical protein